MSDEVKDTVYGKGQGLVCDQDQGSVSHWGSDSLLLLLKGSRFWASLEAPGPRGYCSHPPDFGYPLPLGSGQASLGDEGTLLRAALLPEISWPFRP